MAAILGKSAFSSIQSMMGDNKPHSSITDWLEILSSPKYNEDDYDGIPELVESINLQAAGPTEASRAIRKKLKYGDVHRQLRALTILKALVENCGPRFQASFANDSLTERIKTMATDPLTDEHVKKKLMSVLASWHRQFKDDPKMHLIANMYYTCGGGTKKPVTPHAAPSRQQEQQREAQRQAEDEARRRADLKEAQRQELEEAKRKAKAEKEERRKPKPKPAPAKSNVKRKPFNFEQEKPLVLSSISSASQASNNLINALKLVNREQESIEANVRVQECLAAAKVARKAVVRYVQLVENEEIIGTLIDSNERVIAALQLYDHMLKPADQDSDSDHGGVPTEQMQQLAVVTNVTGEGELEKLQDRQRAAILRAKERSASTDGLLHGRTPMPPSQLPLPSQGVHPDLQDLSFGEIGASSSNLPPPIQPRSATLDDDESYHRGSLSDYSDYDSSDEEAATHAAASSSSPYNHRAYDSVVPATSHDGKHGLLDPSDDPFADPFA